MGVNLETFNKFFNSYQRRFVHFAFTYVRDLQIAEDFVVESMMYFWEHREQIGADTNIPAYVLTIVKHKCIDYLRHQQIERDAMAKLSDLQKWELKCQMESLESFMPEEVFTKEIQEIVNQTIESLPERTRIIFLMSRNDCRSYKYIADKLGITTKGVEFHIAKAKQELRKALKDYLTLSVLLYYFS